MVSPKPRITLTNGIFFPTTLGSRLPNREPPPPASATTRIWRAHQVPHSWPPVDVCNFFHGELGGFGLFTEQGVPQKAYQALRAFQGLMETPRRVETRGAVTGKLAFAAGLSMDGREATMLVSNFADPRLDIVLNWKGFAWTGGVTAEIRTVDATSDFSNARTELVAGESAMLRLTLKAPAIGLVRLRPTGSAAVRLLRIDGR